MYQIYWFGIGVFALLMTLAWLFRPLERTTFTSLFAGAAWGLMAITATDLRTTTKSGIELTTGAGLEVQLFLSAMAILSLLAGLLYRFDLYPPDPPTGGVSNGR